MSKKLASVIRKVADGIGHNKVTLYLVYALSAIYILSLATTRKYRTIILFVLFGVIAHAYTSNMIFVMLVPLLLTSFVLPLFGRVVETLENMDKEEDAPKEEAKREEKKKNPPAKKEDLRPADADKESFGQQRKGKTASRLDLGNNLLASYQNMESLLPDGAIKALSSDTQQLLSQQLKLSESMQSMQPLLHHAMSFLQGLGKAQM